MRLLLDQGLPRSAAKLLREAGVDAVHTAECGLAAAPDDAIVDYARREGQVIITLDADFHTILAVRRDTAPSVVRIRIEGLRAEAVTELVQTILQHCSESLSRGAMVSVTSDRIRIRHLPV